MHTYIIPVNNCGKEGKQLQKQAFWTTNKFSEQLKETLKKQAFMKE